MAAVITRTEIRQEMLRRLPSLGRVLTADSFTTTPPTLVHVSEYERQRTGLTSYEGQYIYRYNLADPDRWRRISTVDAASGIISVDGPAYVNIADTAYERLGLHPDIINGFIAESQRRQRVRTNIALVASYTHDLDMEDSSTAYWDGSLGGFVLATSLAKIATNVRSGTQVLQATTTNANNFLRSEVIHVDSAALMFTGIIFKALSLAGSFTFKVIDLDHGEYFGNTQTISGITTPTFTLESPWIYTYVQGQIPAGCNNIQLEFSTNNSGDVYLVDTCFGPYQSEQTDFTLQTALNEAYKLRFVRPAHFRSAMSTANFFSAESLVFDGDYSSPENFVVETFRRDAVANRLRLIPSTYYPNPIASPAFGSFSGAAGQATMRPVWLAMEAQVSDFEPLPTEGSVTSQPLDECASWSIKLLSEYVLHKSPSPYWQNVFNEYKGYAEAESMSRPPQPRMPPRRLHSMRV